VRPTRWAVTRPGYRNRDRHRPRRAPRPSRQAGGRPAEGAGAQDERGRPAAMRPARINGPSSSQETGLIATTSRTDRIHAEGPDRKSPVRARHPPITAIVAPLPRLVIELDGAARLDRRECDRDPIVGPPQAEAMSARPIGGSDTIRPGGTRGPAPSPEREPYKISYQGLVPMTSRCMSLKRGHDNTHHESDLERRTHRHAPFVWVDVDECARSTVPATWSQGQKGAICSCCDSLDRPSRTTVPRSPALWSPRVCQWLDRCVQAGRSGARLLPTRLARLLPVSARPNISGILANRWVRHDPPRGHPRPGPISRARALQKSPINVLVGLQASALRTIEAA
jgi:hypothetical protein